ncbi:MAG: ribosome maturation factor RimP [Acidimicrobiia bacterium]|nr:ribosome maturation factor RimP [Acidimicrobiia bacterium]
MKAAIVEKVTGIVERAGRADGIEPVEVQWLGSGSQRLLRIYIDKPEGVTHEDCERISEHVGTVLDVEDVVPGGGYRLEVSSPGVERKLTRPKDFERFTGKKVKLVLREPIAGRKHWEGTLAGFQNDVIRLDPGGGTSLEVPLAMVNRANLKFDW